MNTSHGAAMSPRLKQRWIIARGLLLIVAAALLSACSATRLAYHQAPNLGHWWLDSHVDFTDGQSIQIRKDIDSFFAWHRSTELPLYADRLAQWRALMPQDISAEQACAQFEVVKAGYLRLVERSLEPLARLALQLSPEQMEHLQRHQGKGNETFEKDFLRGSPVQRLDKRMEQTTDRYETLYGTLTDAQRALLKVGVQLSPFDPQRTQAERLRRQADLQQSIRQMQAQPAAAVGLARAWFQRRLQSPTPGYAAYSQQRVRHGCAQFAALHASTSPEQRAHAMQTLKNYEDDLRALMAPH